MMRDRDNKGRFVASMHCQYDDDRKEKMDKNYANYGELYEYMRKPSIQMQNDDLVFTIHGITGYFLWLVLLFLILPWIYFIHKSGYIGSFFNYFGRTIIDNIKKDTKTNGKDSEIPGL